MSNQALKGYIWTGLYEGSCSIFCNLCLDEFHFVNGDFDMWIVNNDKSQLSLIFRIVVVILQISEALGRLELL